MSETMRFMVEVEGHFPREGVCVRILNHLQKHCESISRIPHPPTVPNPPVMEHRITLPPQQPTNHIQTPLDYAIPQNEPNNNGAFSVGLNGTDLYEKHPDCNGHAGSYKYKTNIKMRFSQDLNEGVKRQKVENNGRRGSVTSVENHRYVQGLFVRRRGYQN